MNNATKKSNVIRVFAVTLIAMMSITGIYMIMSKDKEVHSSEVTSSEDKEKMTTSTDANTEDVEQTTTTAATNTEEVEKTATITDENKEEAVAQDDLIPIADLEDKEVTLSGTITIEMFYGPPNYGENPETDSKEHVYILTLDESIKTEEGELTKIQVVPIGDTIMHEVDTAVGTHVSMEGSLFIQQTGHHHTRILIDVDKLIAE